MDLVSNRDRERQPEPAKQVKPIKYLKLVNGDEIIAETNTNTVSMVINLFNPVRIVMFPNPTNPKSPQVGLLPWAQFTDDTQINIDKTSVIAIMNPTKQFVDQYKSIFSTIIQSSSPPIVLPRGSNNN